MCGIVGYVGSRDSVPIVLDGLRRLEYRGYDSAGVAVARLGGITVHKATGKVCRLAESVPAHFQGATGIGHTRWATHGVANEVNAHPHVDTTGRIAVVHNGIIENAAELRASLMATGVELRSETDTEVLAHLVSRAAGDDLGRAVIEALAQVEGTYGLAVLDARWPDRIVVARRGSPVVIGVGDGEHFVASDMAALVPFVDHVLHLDEGEVGVITASRYVSFDGGRCPTAGRLQPITGDATSYEKGGFAHFMRKEIAEQPEAVARTLAGRLDIGRNREVLATVGLTAADVATIRRVKFLGCGSAYYAGMAGALLIEQVVGLPADAEPASEFRYKHPVIEHDTLYIAVSQSGETLDTLRAVEEVQRQGGRVAGVVNVVGSSIARKCGAGLYVHAGPEISVTSTKSFTCTVAGMAALAVHLAYARTGDAAAANRLLDGLRRIPGQIETILDLDPHIAEVATRASTAHSAFYVGRVQGYPIAREGAQKLKEISYIHAEAYPCSELKHGPLALVTEEVPTIALVPDDELFAKNVSTLEEIRARRGPIVAVGHSKELKRVADDVFLVPKSEPELDPLLLAVPLQLFAYHAAVALGVDVDQPRNLAKSVTVE